MVSKLDSYSIKASLVLAFITIVFLGCGLLNKTVADITPANPAAKEAAPTEAGNQASSGDLVTYGAPGSYMRLSFSSPDEVAAAWTKCLEIENFGAGWKNNSDIFLYIQSTQKDLDQQVLSTLGPGASLMKYAPAGPAVVSDLHLNTLLSKGGLMLTLAKDSAGPTLDAGTQEILARRLNDLVRSGFWLQSTGSSEIIVLIGGGPNVDTTVRTLKQTGLMEIVSFLDEPLPVGAMITTDSGGSASGTPDAHVILTGQDFTAFKLDKDTLGSTVIFGTLSEAGEKVMASFSAANVNQYVGIAIDKKLILVPRISGPVGKEVAITTGASQDLSDLLVLLKYGPLPDPLKVIESQVVGPVKIP